jgi:hypothetical protein
MVAIPVPLVVFGPVFPGNKGRVISGGCGSGRTGHGAGPRGAKGRRRKAGRVPRDKGCRVVSAVGFTVLFLFSQPGHPGASRCRLSVHPSGDITAQMFEVVKFGEGGGEGVRGRGGEGAKR